MFLKFYPITEDEQVSVVLAFVGIAATFVVISNYAQVNNIERKVDNFEKSMEYKITDYDLSVSAVFEQLYGISYLDRNITDVALRCFINAIEYLNKSSYKEPLENIISCIKEVERLETQNPVASFSISPTEKQRYISALKKCGSTSSGELIDFISDLKITTLINSENKTQTS